MCCVLCLGVFLYAVHDKALFQIRRCLSEYILYKVCDCATTWLPPRAETKGNTLGPGTRKDNKERVSAAHIRDSLIVGPECIFVPNRLKIFETLMCEGSKSQNLKQHSKPLKSC